MNKKNLQMIFKKYIDNFEHINNKTNDENYKWEIAQQFQAFDVDAEDFVGMLTQMWKLSANLVDSSRQLPFYALVDYAKEEPETVREMFRKLFMDEHMEWEIKQKHIQEFIEASETLRQKYSPDSHLYVNNQRSVMQYLFLRYPESNFGYKASQAKSFADCIEFYEDWGPMTHFRLDVYYKMCEQLVEEIKNNEALLKTHKSRYENTDRNFHPDKNLHILAMDIIYSSQAYDFYNGITFEPINAQTKKLHIERMAKAKELEVAHEKAAEDYALLTDAKAYFVDLFRAGEIVSHRKFGEGKVEVCDGSRITVKFSQLKCSKELGLFTCLLNGLLSYNSEDLNEKIKLYENVMRRESQIVQAYKRTAEELQPYIEYLD